MPENAKEPLTSEEVDFVYILMQYQDINLEQLVEALSGARDSFTGNQIWPRKKIKEFLSEVTRKGIFIKATKAAAAV